VDEYKLVNPSDDWSFLAPSNKIAFLVAIAVGRGQTPAERGEWQEGMYLGGIGDPGADYKRMFGEALEGAIERNKAEMIQSLRTFMIARHKSKKTLTGEDLRKWNDEHRSSMNDWGLYALQIADVLEKADTKKGVPRGPRVVF